MDIEDYTVAELYIILIMIIINIQINSNYHEYSNQIHPSKYINSITHNSKW